MCRGTQKYEIVRRGWGTEIGDSNIWGGGGLCGDFEPSGQTLGMLILGGRGSVWRLGDGPGVQGQI